MKGHIGEVTLYKTKRMRFHPALILFIVTALFLSACGIQANTNWPGMSALGDQVYVAYGPEVVAVNIPDQEIVWRFPEEPSRILYLAAPSVYDDLVVLGDYGEGQGALRPGVKSSLYYFSDSEAAASGTPRDVQTSPSISEDRIIAPVLQTEDAIYLGTADNKVFGIERRPGGGVQWTLETEGSIWGQPTAQDGTVFVTSMDRSVYALDGATGEQKWKNTLSGAISAKPFVADDVVYVASYDAKVHAFDAQSGDELWSSDATNWIWDMPAVTDSAVFYADNGGKVFSVDRETGNPLWDKDVANPVIARPLVQDDVVYIATGRADRNATTGTIFALSAEDGSQLWTVETSSPVFTSPVIVDDALVVFIQDTENGNAPLLNVYELQSGILRWSMPLQNNDQEQ